MLKKIAIAVGIGSQVIANAAVVNESGDLGVWTWQAPQHAVARCLVVSSQPFVAFDGFRMKLEQVEVVRWIDVNIQSLPEVFDFPGFLDIDLDAKLLDALMPQAAKLDMLERILPKATFAFIGEPVLCPDRPVIPDWAWAWELSSSDGW